MEKLLEELNQSLTYEKQRLIEKSDKIWTFDYHNGYIDGLTHAIEITKEYIRKTYKITISHETEIDAENEEEAMEKFWSELTYPNTDMTHAIEKITKIEEIT